MAKLAQTSIRFRQFEISEERFKKLSVEVDAAVARVTETIYGPSVEVDIVLESGSLLIRITVIGGILLATYDAISKYPDFKNGAIELVKDAEEYGSAILDEVLKVTGRKKPDSVATRNMTPGKIVRVIEKLEKLKELQQHAPNRVVQQQLEQISRDVKAIERDLEPHELKYIDEALELSGLLPFEKLPKPVIDEVPRAILREERHLKRATSVSRKKFRHHSRFLVGDKPQN